jgi:putative ABC transport system permease protein
MFRNYLAAALRNLSRNRLYAGVTIFGMAVGFTAALLIGLYVRDELTYDRFIPGAGRVYLYAETILLPAARPIESASTPMMAARPLKADFAQVDEVARLVPAYFPPVVRHGELAATEQNVFWADPGFFRVLPLPVVAGDLARAMEAPDAVVLTRAMARKYFGKDAPIGETLQIDRQPMRVAAVIGDLPSNTHLTADFIASSRAPQSPISRFEYMNGPLTNVVLTYVRLKPGASAEGVRAGLPDFVTRRLRLKDFGDKDVRIVAHLVPLTRLHLTPFTQGMVKPPADAAVLGAIGAIGLLILAVAAMNFVTLMTARGARRAIEVGVRKATGAQRLDLILQFLCEAEIYVLAAALIAASMAELLLPAADALLRRRLVLDYLHDPALVAVGVAIVLLTGLAAGFYPAFVLSSFRPASVLKGGGLAAMGGAQVRKALVVGQFAILVALVIIATTIARQTVFALNEGMRVNKDQVLLMLSQPCKEGFRDQLQKLPGVKASACASYEALSMGDNRDSVTFRGRQFDLAASPVDYSFFTVFGLRPLAGRGFDRDRPADGAMDNPDTRQPVILNETAVRRLGFSSPQAAIGQTVSWHGFWDESLRARSPVVMPARPSEIIGVVPDFTLGSMRQPILPTLYAIGRELPPNSVGLAIKLDGKRMPETLAAIDRLWNRYGDGRPPTRVFVDLFTMRLYVDTIIQGGTVAIAGVIALSIAALGLFALSAYTTEQRTKEIGVRKAMGASSLDILKLLLWQFTRPVLWANLIAWPVAFVVLRWWLAGFAYHVDLAAWTFAVAGLGAVVIALATVFAHALNVARAKPVSALRYE